MDGAFTVLRQSGGYRRYVTETGSCTPDVCNDRCRGRWRSSLTVVDVPVIIQRRFCRAVLGPGG